MPEGDTLYKVREALRPDLLGEQLRRVELWGRRAPSLERRVERVITTGKHLFIALDSGEMIRSHLGMHGTWHRYKHGSQWRLPRPQASLALWTERLVLVCFRAKEVECLTERYVKTHRTLGRLGPDLLDADFEEGWYETILQRADHFADPAAPVVDLLLDQRICCGIGNVYKNESLFIEATHPKRPISSLDPGHRLRLMARSRELMLANLGDWFRTTTVDRRREVASGPRAWVYGHRGERCRRCAEKDLDSKIRYGRFGFGRRSTYWCDVCQT